MKKPLGIYIHIPFCVRKCGFCDFLSFPADDGAKSAYVKMLCSEIRGASYLNQTYEVSTVFFGGGTPSVPEASLISDILECLRDCFDFSDNAEITVECNPGTLTKDKLSVYRASGVNRLSIGLQSADDGELVTLGRIHTFTEFKESFLLAREAGFDNINVDLMSALPGQSEESWMYTLEKTAAFNPEHISAYSLMIEEGTPFYEKYGDGAPFSYMLPDEETDRRMYAATGDFLFSKGYTRYEISNYAVPGYECRHNLSYWNRTDYRGFGLGASSLIENVRFKNTSVPDEYMKGLFPREEEIFLTEKDITEERMFLGLRKTSGVEMDDYLEEIYGDRIKAFINLGLMSRSGPRVKLTDRGIDVSNRVLAEFLL